MIFLHGDDATQNATDEIDRMEKLQAKRYLRANGILRLVNENNEELVYYSQEIMNKLYNEQYLAKVESKPDYANSVWEYLGKCYTDGANGISMYSYEKIEKNVTNWEFKDKESAFGTSINRTINFNETKKRELQNIEYYSLVSEYSTPLELMVSLMEISSSKEFLNSFLEKVANKTEITVKLYKTGYSYNEVIKEEMEETTTVTTEKVTDDEIDQVRVKTNEGTIYQTTTKLTEEYKYDVVIEEVQTWYAKISFNNTKNTDIIYETLNEQGNIVTTTTNNPIIISGSKDSEVYNRDEVNKDTIFNKNSSVDELQFKNGETSTNEECINAKLIYALDEGIEDAWFKNNYDPIKMESDYNQYKYGKLYTSTNTYLVDQPPTFADNSEVFLSLLKNNSGTYSLNAQYNANGKEVEYEGLYGRKVKVGSMLVIGENMMYELLESSPNTQGLVDVMINIMNKYKTGSSSAINWNFSIYNLNDVTNIIGNTLEEKLWCNLLNQGLSEYAVAAIMGNIYGDPNFNESKLGDTSSENIGLLQWGGTRKIGLISYANSKSISEPDINTQIEYLIGEISQNGGCNGYARYQLQDFTYNGATYSVDQWKNSTDIEEATKTFYYIFNKPSTELTDFTTRINKTQEYYNRYNGKSIEDITGINQTQSDIVNIAQNSASYGITAQQGYCLAWVNDVYEAAGVTTERKCCAYCSGYSFGVSDDFSIIPIGAAVYGESYTTSGRIYGHVGIYLGNGQVADNMGYVRITTLEKWLEEYPNGCWGWTSSTPVNESYPVTQGLIHAGRHN